MRVSLRELHSEKETPEYRGYRTVSCKSIHKAAIYSKSMNNIKTEVYKSILKILTGKIQPQIKLKLLRKV